MMKNKGINLVVSTDIVIFFSNGDQPSEYSCIIQNRSISTVLIRAALRKGSDEVWYEFIMPLISCFVTVLQVNCWS